MQDGGSQMLQDMASQRHPFSDHVMSQTRGAQRQCMLAVWAVMDQLTSVSKNVTAQVRFGTAAATQGDIDRAMQHETVLFADTLVIHTVIQHQKRQEAPATWREIVGKLYAPVLKKPHWTPGYCLCSWAISNLKCFTARTAK